MVNYEQAKVVFNNFLQNYDINDSKIKLKLDHTFEVVKMSEYIAKKLNLSREDIELAKLIALLHDIGRFDQIKEFTKFVDNITSDHAELGVKMLFNSELIRDFIADDKYDQIIMKAISNHNKYQIEEGLSESEELHCKIIRDADKLDNFRVKVVEEITDIADITFDNLTKGYISDEIYADVISCQSILVSKRKTDLDFWISIIAFIYDINFNCSFKYIKTNDYVNKLIDRINYQNPDTKTKMETIRLVTNQYIDKKINNRNYNQ